MASSLKVPPAVVKRIARVVKGTGVTVRAFMLRALDSQTARESARVLACCAEKTSC
jgi:hypothetical protein